MWRYPIIPIFLLSLALSSQTISIHLGDTLYLEPETTFEVKVEVEGFQSIIAFQLTMGWDTSALRFIDIIDPLFSDMSVRVEANKVVVAWASTTGTGQSREQISTLFRIRLGTRTECPVSSQLVFLEDPLSLQFYSIDGNEILTHTVFPDSLTVITRKCTGVLVAEREQSLCLGDSLLLTIDCEDCLSIQWEDGSVGEEKWIYEAGTYKVQGQRPYSCLVFDSFTITAAPPPAITLLDSVQICPGESVKIMAQVEEPVSYWWSNGNQSNTLETSHAGLYSLSVINSQGCYSLATVEVQLKNPEAGILKAERDSICPLDSITLTYEGPEDYWWNLESDDILDEKDNSILVAPSVSTNYLLTYFDGCSDTTIVMQVYVNQSSIQIEGDTLIEQGEETTLSVPEGKEIYWQGNDILGPVNQSSIIARPDRTSSYTVQLIDLKGCPISRSVTVQVTPSDLVYAPNIISPNGDGVNDFFTLYGGPTLKLINQLDVFNRWGEHVFQGKNIPPNEDVVGWNGEFRSFITTGEYVYFAVVEFQDGKRKELKGAINVLR